MSEDKKARKVVKSARWLLLRNRDTIKKDEDRVRLDELLAANQALMTTYVLKDDFKQLCRFRDDDYFFLKIRAAFPGIPG